jgi:hypothetical protein
MEDLRVVCDQCGSWQIQHRLKVELPIRHVNLSQWVKEIPAPRTEPGSFQPVAMVAECMECHFTVEYSRLVSS